MKEIKANIKAGESVFFAVKGRYFRLMEAGSSVQVDFPDLGIRTNYRVGVGIKLDQFNGVRIYSDIEQTIVFVVSNEKVDDQRVITEEKAGMSYSAPAVVSLVAGVAKEVLTLDTARFKANIQADADMYIGSNSAVTTATGIKIAAGAILEIKNKAALWCISASNTSVRTISEFE